MRFFIKKCKKCEGTLAGSDTDIIFSCLNCGAEYVLVTQKDGVNFVVLDRA